MAPPGVPAEAFEVSGSIKWFDVAKGYGFIRPTAGPQGDILLHLTCVRQSGFKFAQEGAKVVCEAVKGPKGLQAFRVLSMDESTAVHPAQMPPPRTHVTVTPTSGQKSFCISAQARRTQLRMDTV